MSVVACSFGVMDGGTGRPSGSGEPAGSGEPDELNEPEDAALSALAAARAELVAADAQVLAGHPFLAEVFARLDAVLDDLAEVRWAACSPEQVRAGIRAHAARLARLDAAG